MKYRRREQAARRFSRALRHACVRGTRHLHFLFMYHLSAHVSINSIESSVIQGEALSEARLSYGSFSEHELSTNRLIFGKMTHEKSEPVNALPSTH